MNFQNKKRKEFEDVYQRYKVYVFRTSMHYSGSHEESAKEIVQDVFEKLYTCFDKVEEGSLKNWLSVTTRNMTINYMSKRARETLKGDMSLVSDLYSKEHNESAEDVVLRKMLLDEKKAYSETILDALYKENDRWYEAVIRVYCMGMKQQDAADSIGISLEALTALLYRARKWVKKNYDSDNYT